MLFSELRFLIFFAIVFIVHWTIAGRGSRKAWLLLSSWAFYAAWDWRFLTLIWASTLLDYGVGRAIAAGASGRIRRLALGASLVGNLGILGFFKYFDFFVQSGVQLSGWLGLPLTAPTLEIILPLGISFYTFQTLSYSIDVYRGVLEPRYSLLDFALYVAFFPQLVAGPIVRAKEFLPQLDGDKKFARVALRSALLLFFLGWAKKTCVADQIAIAIDPVFLEPDQFISSAKLLALMLYCIQIYCDFSGYSDMAIASAALPGSGQIACNFGFVDILVLERSRYATGESHGTRGTRTTL